MQKIYPILCVFIMLILWAGCSTSHEVEVKPVEVKPIHITIDVNVKVDRALDNFFGDIDEAKEQIIQE
ncbi:MAG: YnbE family lipoprotein [Desulfamplus sp.]|nr:YnbE family lipoprotein [Desulfamplus sp.]